MKQFEKHFKLAPGHFEPEQGGYKKNMKYQTTRQQFYKDEICKMARQMSQLLDDGYSIEISKSRSGLKLFKVSRKYEQIRKGAVLSDIPRND